METYNTLPYAEGDKEKVDKILTLWDTLAKGKVNTIYERHVFNSYVQTNESMDEFIQKCKAYASTCSYGTMRDELIRDKIVTGVKDAGLKQQLLNQEGDFTLSQCINMCKSHVASRTHMRAMTDEHSSNNVNAVNTNARSTSTRNSVLECKFCGENRDWLSK